MCIRDSLCRPGSAVLQRYPRNRKRSFHSAASNALRTCTCRENPGGRTDLRLSHARERPDNEPTREWKKSSIQNPRSSSRPANRCRARDRKWRVTNSPTLPLLSFRHTTHKPVSYTHLRAHETPEHLVCRLL